MNLILTDPLCKRYAFIFMALGCGLPILLSYINFDFTLPRVITWATNCVTTFAWLKLL